MQTDSLRTFLVGVLAPEYRKNLVLNPDADPRLQGRLDLLDQEMRGDSVTPVKVPQRHLRQTTRAETPFDGFVDRVCQFLDLAVTDTERVLDLALVAPAESLIAPGVHAIEIEPGARRAKYQASIVWVSAGAGFPRHRHRGDERGLMLQGRLVDDLSNDYLAGDYFLHRSKTEHLPINPGVEKAIFLNLIEGGYDWL